MSPVAVAPRLRLDLGVRDVLAGMAACAAVGPVAREERRLLQAWGAGEEGLACLSVRSAFDLLLGALRLPEGSEAAFTAITHPDMVRIARAHGLRVVPLDLDAATLAPTAEALDGAIGPVTRLVVVAHLFGGRIDLAPIAARARAQGALLVEDCAQALRGPADHGDTLADASLFSFGAIKTATALGGALVRIRDPQLRAAVVDAQRRLPRQTRPEQLAKLFKFSGLVLLGRPLPYGLLLRVLARAGRDADAFVNGVVRAFPSGAVALEEQRTAELLRRVRRSPSAPLLALVRRRLRRFDNERLARRAAFGEVARAALPDGLVHAGRLAAERTHWVFPVLAPDPDRLVAALRAEGIDAARATSSIEAIDAPVDAPTLMPHAARALMRQIVFVPVYPELGVAGLRRHLRAVRRAGASQAGSLPEPEGVLVPARSRG